MNIDFQMALQYIDLGNYTKAVDSLRRAIETETTEGNNDAATEYRCVLGELYTRLDMKEQAIKELLIVKEYCDKNKSLPKQNAIATQILYAYQTNKIDELFKEEPKAKRPGYAPLVPKPVQDRSFISKQMSKKRR
ncbi:MAG: tetratricopeptide repeat protein [Oscillospiraceae bacterium]|nr:tetratricopeptide repeat protein [Oscillospiraceae bacterium]MBQ4166165.1 tetratricopeptide repeat protein [Oscillospiraceae bacterium]